MHLQLVQKITIYIHSNCCINVNKTLIHYAEITCLTNWNGQTHLQLTKHKITNRWRILVSEPGYEITPTSTTKRAHVDCIHIHIQPQKRERERAWSIKHCNGPRQLYDRKSDYQNLSRAQPTTMHAFPYKSTTGRSTAHSPTVHILANHQRPVFGNKLFIMSGQRACPLRAYSLPGGRVDSPHWPDDLPMANTFPFHASQFCGATLCNIMFVK